MANQNLVDFIKEYLSKGFNEQALKQGLMQKGWPLSEIDVAFTEAKYISQPKQETKQPIKVKPDVKEEKEELIVDLEKSTIDKKKILYYGLSFLGIIVILLFTLLVFFYMNGVIDYTIKDPVTGKTLTKSCIYQDCSDMKQFAIDNVKSHILISLIISIVVAIALVVIYHFIRYKNIFFWVSNALYLLFLAIIIYMWITFNAK